jgi:Leucine-rich repeat (LRR) protein
MSIGSNSSHNDNELDTEHDSSRGSFAEAIHGPIIQTILEGGTTDEEEPDLQESSSTSSHSSSSSTSDRGPLSDDPSANEKTSVSEEDAASVDLASINSDLENKNTGVTDTAAAAATAAATAAESSVASSEEDSSGGSSLESGTNRDMSDNSGLVTHRHSQQGIEDTSGLENETMDIAEESMRRNKPSFNPDPILTPEKEEPSAMSKTTAQDMPRIPQFTPEQNDEIESVISDEAVLDNDRDIPQGDEDPSWENRYAMAAAAGTYGKPKYTPEELQKIEKTRKFWFFVIVIYLMIVQPLALITGLATTAEERENFPENRPTAAPTSGIDDGINETEPEFQFLVEQSFDGGEGLFTEGSPQRRAYLWLSTFPQNTASNRRIQNVLIAEEDRLLQRYTLATLYYATNLLNSTIWEQTIGWLTFPNECDWYASKNGDGYNDVDGDDIVCDDEGHYVSLSLSYNGLQGQLPLELGYMTRLRTLNLRGNQLSGTLPTTLSELTKLQLLSMADNSLTGTLPIMEGQRTSFWNDLRVWKSQNNLLSGSIPNSFMQGMTQLRVWNLSGNRFSGELPSSAMSGLSRSLVYTDLSHNQFSGPLPTQWGDLSSLATLELGHNLLTRLPQSIAKATNLRTLYAPFNDLEGPLQLETADGAALRFLVDLDLSHNQLSGTLPSFSFAPYLRDLELGHNRFVGQIPTSFGLLTDLMDLKLQSNRLTGNIPTELSSLTALREVRLEDNDITGLVPNSVCDTFELEEVIFYSDCRSNDVPAKVTCPRESCCTFCCAEGIGCEA